jgi:hypothetical protein
MNRFFFKPTQVLLLLSTLFIFGACKKKDNPLSNAAAYNNNATEWRLLNESRGLSGNEIMAIDEDASGKVWVSTFSEYNEPMGPPVQGWWILPTTTLQQVTKMGNVAAKIDSSTSLLLKSKVSAICFGTGDEMYMAYKAGFGSETGVISRLNGVFSKDIMAGVSYGIFDNMIKNDFGLWMGRRYEGLYNFNNGTFTKYNSANSSIPNNPQRFEIVKKNEAEFFVNTRQKLIYKWSGGISDFLMADVWADGMDVDSNGHVWMVRLNTAPYGYFLTKYTGAAVSTLTSIATPINYDEGTVSSLVIDSHGNIWIATQGTNFQGLFKYNGTSWKQYTMANSPLHSQNLTKLFVDSEGNLWIGSSDAGVLVLNEFGTRD